MEALFTTVTNVNFDPTKLSALVRRGGELRDKARRLFERAASKSGTPAAKVSGPATWEIPSGREALLAESRKMGIDGRKAANGDDVTGLQELLTYGVKGTAAYADHALVLGQESDEVFAFFHEATLLPGRRPQRTSTSSSSGTSSCGEVNFKVMGCSTRPIPTTTATPCTPRCA